MTPHALCFLRNLTGSPKTRSNMNHLSVLLFHKELCARITKRRLGIAENMRHSLRKRLFFVSAKHVMFKNP